MLFSGDLGKEAGNAVPQCPAWGTGDGREGEGKLRAAEAQTNKKLSSLHITEGSCW